MNNQRSSDFVDRANWCFNQARGLEVNCILILNKSNMYAVGMLHPVIPTANNDNEAKS